MAGDFRQFPPQVRQIGSLETKANARKAGISGPFSRFWEARPNPGLVGCPGRDRTPKFPITLPPLKSLENFRQKSRFAPWRLFRLFAVQSGARRRRHLRYDGSIMHWKLLHSAGPVPTGGHRQCNERGGFELTQSDRTDLHLNNSRKRECQPPTIGDFHCGPT